MQSKTPPRDTIRPTLARAWARGQLVTEEVFLSKSGLSAAQLAAAPIENRLFYIEFQHTRSYPAFFLDATLPVGSASEVSHLLGSRSPGGKFLFFTQPNAFLALAPDTSRTPLEALRDGDVERVKRLASAEN